MRIGCVLIFVAGLAVYAQQPNSNSAVHSYVIQNQPTILHDFEQLLAIPNIASDTPNIEKNAALLLQMLEKRGLKAELLRVENAPPAVLAQGMSDPALHTVTFYAHYDGQPVQKADWKQDPWQPTMVPGAPSADQRIYARSASDDKAAIIGLISAVDALKSTNKRPSVNIKFLFEGEEEAGSPHLEQILSRYHEKLQSDLFVICDGPIYQNGQPDLMFGSRGIVTVQITAFGPNRPLHSGHYGNWAPNPIVELADLLTKLRNTEGEILIPHFYDPVRPLSAAEKDALAKLPDLDDQLKKEFAIGRSEGQGKLPEEIMKPGLNLDRIEGGGSGPNPANAIPSSATAYIDFRLVPNQTPAIVKQQLQAYLLQLGYFLIDNPPTATERVQHSKLLQLKWGAGYPPQRTPIDEAASQAFIRAARTVAGDSLVLMPTLGGSTPSFLFEQKFNKPVIGLPIANFDNNQHAANENIKLENLWRGIELYAGIYASLGEFWR